MKIKTNLSPTELKLIAKGLEKAAESHKAYSPENEVEAKLLSDMDKVFDQFVFGLRDGIITNEF